jgi:hypothetical protein
MRGMGRTTNHSPAHTRGRSIMFVAVAVCTAIGLCFAFIGGLSSVAGLAVDLEESLGKNGITVSAVASRNIVTVMFQLLLIAFVWIFAFALMAYWGWLPWQKSEQDDATETIFLNNKRIASIPPAMKEPFDLMRLASSQGVTSIPGSEGGRGGYGGGGGGGAGAPFGGSGGDGGDSVVNIHLPATPAANPLKLIFNSAGHAELNAEKTQLTIKLEVKNTDPVKTIENVTVRVKSVEPLNRVEPHWILDQLKDVRLVVRPRSGVHFVPDSAPANATDINANDFHFFEFVWIRAKAPDAKHFLFHAEGGFGRPVGPNGKTFWEQKPQGNIELGAYRITVFAQGKNTPPTAPQAFIFWSTKDRCFFMPEPRRARTVYGKRVYRVGDRWEYEILQNGSVGIHQDFHPDASGFVPMDDATANACADVVLKRLRTADAQPP